MAILKRLPLAARLAIVLCVAAIAPWACFNPQRPGCAFSCATDRLCPSGYSCGTDNLCHRDDGQGTCTLNRVPDDAAGGDSGERGDAQTSDGAGGQ